MAYNFLRGDRDQPFWLPPDLRDWLPADHLAWFVRDVVDQLDLEPFLRVYSAPIPGLWSFQRRELHCAGQLPLMVEAVEVFPHP
jgi:hypothetical protein